MPNIEELLQRAIREGKFDHLPGKGQPLRLDDNPYADPDWQLAYHLLKQNGFALPWLELRQELETEIETARHALLQAWEWLNSISADQTQASKSQPPGAEKEAVYQRALQKFTEEVAHLNQRIFDYNLQAPLERFQMRKLDLQGEVSRICNPGH
jgi:DnaJ homolog subfamily C member 28